MHPVLALSLVSAAQAAGLHGPTHPRCVDSFVRVHPTARNFDLRGLDVTQNLPKDTATFQVSGRFSIQVRFCEPTVHVAQRVDTLQIFAPGATYSTVYWDIGFQPDTYSYVRFAAAQGYATLNIPRLEQIPMEVAAEIDVFRLARAGTIPGAKGRKFRTIIGVGHSLSGVTLNGVVANAPEVLQAAIFTGYSHSGPGGNLTAIAHLMPAREVDPRRFGHLPLGYLTSLNATTRSAAFYDPAGSFDPRALAFDESTKDTFSENSIEKPRTTVVAAPQFRGHVLTVNGANDGFFCDPPACENIERESEFYPKARSVNSAVIQGSGHCLNFHFAAPTLFKTIQAWLDRHGF
ncbi:hypothetical protein AURDEDRAFT_159127 [Auricularia subglabra TFB-10046 SS5]|nr:hypothetical protein AURDEDRAFT_159127 [Auricularia subglabra TFB-10046 SS5]